MCGVKRIFLCMGIFVILMAYAVICHIHVSSSVYETITLLNRAVESYESGDYPASQKHAIAAYDNWKKLSDKGGLVLVDLTLAADIAVSLTRVKTIAVIESGDHRFAEECMATIAMLKHFLEDNQNLLTSRPL